MMIEMRNKEKVDCPIDNIDSVFTWENETKISDMKHNGKTRERRKS